jgi:fructose-specific phosphotransferase system IIC component
MGSSKWSRFVPSRLRRRTEDATTLVKDYLVQETVGPLKTLKWYLVYGTIGSVFVGIGVLMLLIALLRLLQGQSALQGHLSWLPYLIVVVVAAAVAGATVAVVMGGPARRKRPKGEAR